MRNDPYAASASALSRSPGHITPASQGKWDVLSQPLGATGVPLGGLGTGGITRSSDGRFSRWTLKAGNVRNFDLPANGFILRTKPENGVARTIALQPEPASDVLSKFAFEPQTPEWEGLFPLSWHRHAPVQGITAETLSFSPVFPGDLSTASRPTAVFRWRLTNTNTVPAEASILFHFANMNGWFNDFAEGPAARVPAGCFNRPAALNNGVAVILDRKRTASSPPEGTGEWALSATGPQQTVFSRTTCFDGTGDGGALWSAFDTTGDAPDLGAGWVTEAGFREVSPGLPTAAVCGRTQLAPGESADITFVLVWDLPVITFGMGRKWYRAYTDDWGRTGRCALALSQDAHKNASIWETQISAWHRQVERQLGEAPHRAGMALNELYFLTDGLSVYTSAEGSPDGRQHFGLIECHDYALYNTLDLWIYAQEAVARFSPELSASVACDFADFLLSEDLAPRKHRWTASIFPLNNAGACPHDLGGPGEDPFVVPNSYTYRDSTLWKDLNCDLVLCIWRDGRHMGKAWKQNLFPAVRAAIEHLQQFDRDGDGLIENEGIPDQTFDNIPMTGPSSYCGGLWIAALRAASRMAEEARETALATQWKAQADRAAIAFSELLYNGQWFRVDSAGPLSDACFIEQLFGPFIARYYGLGDIVDPAKARSALRSVYRHNFIGEGKGQGAVSLACVPDGADAALPHKDDTSFQTAEIQPGFNFSLAAQLEEWQLWEEADCLRRALYEQLYIKRNLVFQTPAAIDVDKPTCRAIINMRPLSVWWMKPGPPHEKQK